MIEEEAEEILGGSTQNERNKVMWAAIEDAAGASGRVNEIAIDILRHYLSRTSEGYSSKAKP